MQCCGGGEPKDYEMSLWFNKTKTYTNNYGTQVSVFNIIITHLLTSICFFSFVALINRMLESKNIPYLIHVAY